IVGKYGANLADKFMLIALRCLIVENLARMAGANHVSSSIQLFEVRPSGEPAGNSKERQDLSQQKISKQEKGNRTESMAFAQALPDRITIITNFVAVSFH